MCLMLAPFRSSLSSPDVQVTHPRPVRGHELTKWFYWVERQQLTLNTGDVNPLKKKQYKTKKGENGGLAGKKTTLKGHPQLTQSSSHQQHLLHRLSFSSPPLPAQGAFLRGIKPRGKLTALVDHTKLNLTWLRRDHTHHLEKQVNLINVIFKHVFERRGMKDDKDH